MGSTITVMDLRMKKMQPTVPLSIEIPILMDMVMAILLNVGALLVAQAAILMSQIQMIAMMEAPKLVPDNLDISLQIEGMDLLITIVMAHKQNSIQILDPVVALVLQLEIAL